MDIAIIGVGCRFPGASCLGEFWDVLVKGENHVIEIPPDRWNRDTFYDPDVNANGKFYSKKAGFIQNYAHFDNKLFGINESEAAQMDPQQRQVLECTFMALEDAGVTRQQVAGQKVGVYIGAMNSDFTVRMTANSHEIDHYSVAGLAGSVLANRVSYVYNLSGPSMVLDTACSSSLVAIHQAGLALRAGDCEMALCGGVNLLLHPTVFVPLSKAQMLSPSGQCHAFSSNADGYTRGEGCGIVLLKPLAQALRDGDNIWATVSTGVNQDGRAAQPITAPSGGQQLQLLQDLYRAYCVDPHTVEYIEAHGTGTKLGDPIEVNTFGEFFSSPGNQRKRYMGSVKTNIGHLEPAAGVAGLIKVLLMMKYNTIVPSLHFDKPNEHIDFDKFQFIIPQHPLQWTSVSKVACLNSFGFGGTNSHAILHNYNKPPYASRSNLRSSHIVCFSGSSLETLKKSLENFLSCDHLTHDDLPAMAYTSTVRREHFTCRKAFVVKSVNDLKQQAQIVMKSRNIVDINTSPLKIIFVFCGMGTAWSGMCDGFMKMNKTFSKTINMIDVSLKRFVSWSLTKRLRSGYDVEDPLFGPIAIFACQVALAKQWEAWGVVPAVVVGQSVGEVAAAHMAGILSLGEAVRVIYHRTRILAEATGGKMLLVRNLKTDNVQEICDDVAGVNIALSYSPVSCAVSGDSAAVDDLRSRLQLSHSNLTLTDLHVGAAYHSHHMDQSKMQLDSVLANLKSLPARIPMISTADVHLTEKDVNSSEYWGKNVRNPVQFASAIARSTSDNHLNVFIEIGPQPVLKAHMGDIFTKGSPSCLCLPSLTVKFSENTMLVTLSELYQLKVNINWQEIFTHTEPPTPMPCYAFSHKHLMILPVITEEEVFGSNGNSGNHLFVRLSSSTDKCMLNIRPSTFGTVYEHKIKDIIVVPGATYVEAGFGIARSMNTANVRNLIISVSFLNPVILKKEMSVQLDVEVEDHIANDCTKTFTIRSTGVAIAKGRILVCDSAPDEERMDMEAIQERCTETVTGDEVYQALKYSGFTYGPNFATMNYALRGKSESLTKLTVGQKLKEEMTNTVIHPAILDGMLQSAAAFNMQEKEFLPVELKNVTVRHSVKTEMFVYARMTDSTRSHTSFTLTLLSPDGSVIAHVERFSTKFIGSDTFDIHNATFKTSLVPLGSFHVSQNNVDTGLVIFTNVDLTNVDLACVIHELDHMGVEGTKRALDSVIHNIKQICFVFAVTDLKTDTGESLQKELTRRIMSLRLIALYAASRGVSVPLVIISEIRDAGDNAASGCLSEAVKGFMRCVLREYRALHIQLVDVLVDNDEKFLASLPGILSQSTSEDFISETVFKICDSFNDLRVSKLQGTVIPLNISEVLNSTELSLSSDSNFDMEIMMTPSTHLFQDTGSYVVVGGLTGLGWECVTSLAAGGAGSVIILSRRKPNPETQVDMDHLSQQHNCHITSIQTDVTVYKDIETAILKIRKHLKPLKGVFYGAAVLQDASLAEMTEEKLVTAMAPKVTGAWNLHILTADLPLDFFVLHSSGAAVLGNAGQSNYGAGNGFLDGLAVYRRQRGMSGQSINWGPLDLGMLEKRGSVLKKLESQGYMVINKKDISQCLTHMLMLNEPQALVCRIDRQKMAEQLQRDKETTLMMRLKTYLEPAMKILNEQATSEEGKRSCDVDKLRTCSAEEGLQMLREYVKHLVCDKALLDINSFQMDANMKDQGVDSMYAMEITGGILSDIGVKLSTHEIQLQSTCNIAKRILDILSGTEKEQAQASDMETVISKQAISMSIARSVCGFRADCEHNMGFVIVSTISVPDVVNVSTLIAVAKECVSRHPITRTTYIFSHENVSTNTLTLENAFDFRILSGDDMSEVKKHTEEPIHLQHQSPLRFIFLGRSLQLRMVFHRLAFDLKAITILVKELENMANAVQQGKPLVDVVTDTDKDIAKEIQKILAPNFKRVSQFWKTKTKYISYNSLSEGPTKHNVQNDHIFITRTVNNDLYTKILKYARDMGLTPFDYLASIYQLFLAFVSSKTTSTITTSVDLRGLVPALTRSLGRCTNFIPLICQVPEETTTVQEFLQSNSKAIQHFTKYAIYPSEEIKKLVPEVKNLGTNYFIYETDIITSASNQLTVDMPVIFDSSTETFMYIWQRKETRLMEIKFHLRRDLFTTSRAGGLVEAFLGLVADSLNNPVSTVHFSYHCNSSCPFEEADR
ncbi:mycolipanoate synthase-like [Haliotis rufescens]|uniref:mycolipanoate synthase-like n=1 Tax=Haliotis rufescens TaxID=6454 RepID=UPI00201F35F3|nr:mycolipanoate synthase-like [Haliotis rufescens]